MTKYKKNRKIDKKKNSLWINGFRRTRIAGSTGGRKSYFDKNSENITKSDSKYTRFSVQKKPKSICNSLINNKLNDVKKGGKNEKSSKKILTHSFLPLSIYKKQRENKKALSPKWELRSEISLPYYIHPADWEDYRVHREKLNCPLLRSKLSVGRILERLKFLHEDGEDIHEVLRQSIDNGWRGVFPTDKTKHLGNCLDRPRRKKQLQEKLRQKQQSEEDQKAFKKFIGLDDEK